MKKKKMFYNAALENDGQYSGPERIPPVLAITRYVYMYTAYGLFVLLF